MRTVFPSRVIDGYAPGNATKTSHPPNLTLTCTSSPARGEAGVRYGVSTNAYATRVKGKHSSSARTIHVQHRIIVVSPDRRVHSTSACASRPPHHGFVPHAALCMRSTV